MNTVIRHVLTIIFFTLLMSLMTVTIVLLAFPPDDWSLIFDRKLNDIPFLAFVFGVPIIFGTIIGLIISLYWRQRLKHVEHQLSHVEKGQYPISFEGSYRELGTIEDHIEQIQKKMLQQTEQAQRLATERANDRDKILQEIVVQERNRLARELHDSVSQHLFAASMMMSAINELEPPDDPFVERQLNMVEKTIHQSQLEMRALLLHLRPVALKDKSLQEGISELLNELTQKVPLNIEWHTENFTIDKGIEDQLFRILQESVSNTLRHANASSLDVTLMKRDNWVILRVIDDGVGFIVNDVNSGSYGLENMRERALEVGGTFKLISLPNQGTRLEVKVPALTEEGDDND
ncbi:sensor histidine kinase [Lentibacillus saliphilus]|uniref:sensor histidine kinase n=1 Tax=Lentibacillus saliphilus TaxID=2737028 RepID=UPI001C30F932|nr:sensor histidine kinase [Lentibacillus saliphilus]